jgi:hypothetical protein
MKISELISLLEKQKADIGDVNVEVYNGAGDIASPCSVELVNTSRKTGQVRWAVFIDA